MLHILHVDEHEVHEITPALHWLRDSALAVPMALAVVLVMTKLARTWLRRAGLDGSATWQRLAWSAVAALGYALATVPGIAVHGWLFGAEHHEHGSFALHAAHDGIVALGASAVLLVLATLVAGCPRQRIGVAPMSTALVLRGSAKATSPSPLRRRWIPRLLPITVSMSLTVALLPGIAVTGAAQAAATAACSRNVLANVVALDQPFFYNRLGAQNQDGMIYALARDVVLRSDPGTLVSTLAPQALAAAAGNVRLRADKRPRPLVLRANVGDCLEIRFTNLLSSISIGDQPADRHVGIHINGVQLVDPDDGGPLSGIESDGANVGNNPSSVAAPGESKTYRLYAEHENTYLLSNPAVTVGGEASGGTLSYGLFGALNVEPYGTEWYRSQVTRVDMDLAAAAWTGDDTVGWTPAPHPQVVIDPVSGAPQLAIRLTPDGQPIVNYDAKYPTDETVPGYDATKANLPILRMLDGSEIVHSDLNSIVAGPASGGFRIPARAYPLSYWANQVYNMDANRGAEPFREFTAIFHDEIQATQAFPDWFEDPTLEATLHPVRDGFAINYGTAGAGAEIIANRLGLGPMWDCVDCKFEEFFLSSWAIGDPAEVVDVPADQTLGAGGPGGSPGARATKVLYPDDPSNIHHSYINDRVKFRNINAGPKEHHIFHLHAHQWTFMPNTEKSVYLDSQGIGPGSGYTYEIANGGSGNRNKVVGDSIFHCHFYPHFAQGMWELWRTHDTFERGTELDGNGVPVPGSRAQPDGEITAGTPIPSLVPLPGRPMAPVPDAATTVVPYDLDGNVNSGVQADLDADGTPDVGWDSSQVDADGNGIADIAEGTGFENAPPDTNPGFPFFVAGVAGHRPPTPPLDLAWDDENHDNVRDPGEVYDGGLPRHMVLGGTAVQYQTRLDFNKTLITAKLGYVPEEGTPTEQVAMDFHRALWHDTFLPDGTPVNGTSPLPANPNDPTGSRPLDGFETNGLPPSQGAPYSEPCRSDPTPANSWAVAPIGVNRTYKAADIQLDVTINKAGWHYPQQRILVLNDDVGATFAGSRPPEPLVMRLGVNDCASYWQTNLVPDTYQLDDYQVRTPTDIIGQHIHLVKFDVTSADGSANGFNYEDGTLSPQDTRERIDAVRAENGCSGDDRLDPGDTWTRGCPLARLHPVFGNVLGSGVSSLAWGARTTIQKWFADPLMNRSWDQSLGSVFTHDHLGPSTHQQVGLYATVLIEPKDAKWRNPETGVIMGSRSDGGPTSWRADIYWDPSSDPRNVNAHREFYLEFADFQHAYQAGGGQLHTQGNGAGVQIPSYADFANAINPSFRQEPPAGRESDLFYFPTTCANGSPRPCPEAISGDDVGTFVVNYRNEPLGLRVFDPVTGTQAAGSAGDLSRAFESRTDRAIAALNTQPAVYPPLTANVDPGDPFTPLLRAYMGDNIRLRVQVGATEETHNVTVHGIKWLQDPRDPNSGWRNTQTAGISEYFNLEAPISTDTGPGAPARLDYLYTMGAATDDLWNGDWGILRSYRVKRSDLLPLPNNMIPKKGWKFTNKAGFDNSGVCPLTAPIRSYKVTAVRAADILGPNGLVYNSRTSEVMTPDGATQGAGPLIDPTALLYVNTTDLKFDATGKPNGLKPGAPVEPLVLRADAGDCIKVRLTNALPAVVPELPGFNALPAIVHRDAPDVSGVVTFNANDLTPSSLVGLNPQLVSYNNRQNGGLPVGTTTPTLAAPGTSKDYVWYAGDISVVRDGTGLRIVARPVEFGAINLMPADRITGPSNGLGGALVVEPPGASWTLDPGTRLSATVTWSGGAFREFVTIIQDDLNLRYGAGCEPTGANLLCAVPAIGGEGLFPEDPEDAGQKAINYGADPLWFRLGISPDTPFEDPNLRGDPNVHMVYSNALVGGDPETAVFTASPTGPQQVRFRLLQPGGHARGHVFTIDGHAWQREPYVNDSDRLSWTSHDDPTTLNVGSADGTMDGHNMVSWWISAQEGVGPSAHFDLVLPYAGGRFGIQGDYLFRDSASFGNYGGLWGIFRYG